MTLDNQHEPVWRDDPISSATEDTLGRGHVASRTAELVVETHSWESSVVLGLIGPWGSGKSSVLSLTINELAETAPDWKVVRFTPWAAGDINGMLAEFYAAIASALPDKKFDKFKAGLADVVEVSSPAANLVPYAGSVAKGGARWFSNWLRRQKPWAESFKQASATLKELKTPVLVVADDIDRLQGDELLGFLKVIRLVGRFPGLTYLLAYDEDSLRRTIEASSNSVSESSGSQDFLEKFVQYPIYLPPLLSGQLLRRIDAELEDALADTGHSIPEGDGRLSSVGEAWFAYLDTPRAINRFGAQLRLVSPLHRPGEIDIVDLILLTLLRMHFPGVYEALPRHRKRLIGRKARFSNSSSTEFDWAGILDTCADTSESAMVQEVLKTIFPIIRYSGGMESERPRASHHEYFDRYFHQAVPEDDVPDRDAYAALEAASNGDNGPLRELLTTDIGGRIDTAISKLWSFSVPDDDTLNEASLPLLTGIMELLPSLPGRTNSIFSRQQRVARWASDLVRSVGSDVTEESVSEALHSCPDLIPIIDVIWGASRDDDEPAPAVLRFRTSLAGDVLEAFLGQLALRDEAPPDSTSLRMAGFLSHFGAVEAAARFAEEFTSVTFSAEDYAARFVGLSYTISENPVANIDSFATETFQTLTTFDDPFFAEAQSDHVDRDDVSWANRRAFARGRAPQTSA